MEKKEIKTKTIIFFVAFSLFLCISYTKLFSQENKLGIGIEMGVSSLGDNGTDENGTSHKKDNTPSHFYSGKHATLDMGFSFQYNRYILNMSFPINGSPSEGSYGKGELTDNLSGFSMNVGYEFNPFKYFYVYPLVGFSTRANKYSDLYYGKVATGEPRAYFLYGGIIRLKSVYLRGSNDGVSLGYLLEIRFY